MADSQFTPGSIAKLADRFWSYVSKADGDACWLWTGSTGGPKRPYGHIWFSGRQRVAHRAAWFLEHGEMPPDNLHVCHRCDNPRCVRPSHLFLGTNRENMLDASKKGRLRWTKERLLTYTATHCKRGHDLRGVTRTRRVCPTCKKWHDAKRFHPDLPEPIEAPRG